MSADIIFRIISLIDSEIYPCLLVHRNIVGNYMYAGRLVPFQRKAWPLPFYASIFTLLQCILVPTLAGTHTLEVVSCPDLPPTDGRVHVPYACPPPLQKITPGYYYYAGMYESTDFITNVTSVPKIWVLVTYMCRCSPDILYSKTEIISLIDSEIKEVHLYFPVCWS